MNLSEAHDGWHVTIPGQPISQNHAYVPVWRTDRRGRPFRARALSSEAQRYLSQVVMLVRAAKPSGWAPKGQVRVILDLYLQHPIDDDNVMKLIGDAIERATGINDSRFLRCTRSMTAGVHPREARVEIEIVAL